MKNTKKYLSFSTGVALAIALFAAVQVSAMAPQVNPYLNLHTKIMIEDEIERLQELLDPRGLRSKRMGGISELDKKTFQAEIKGWEEVLYGDNNYTWQQIQDIIQRHVDRATREVRQ